MKKLILLISAASLTLTGCMAPNWGRLIPDNKSAHIEIASPLYGHVIIDTRVPDDPNPLPPLPPVKPAIAK